MEESNILLTVALPLFNANKIAWLALESLCNQKEITFDWELIICEERNNKRITYLKDYEKRLKEVGCKQIIYIPLKNKLSLAAKWQLIGKRADKNSKAFLLQAGDDYSPSVRLANTYHYIVEKNMDWYDITKGYFYSFISHKTFIYRFQGFTNLNMGFKTTFARKIPNTYLLKGIDGFLMKHCKNCCKGYTIKIMQDSTLYSDTVDTHGYHNISVKRESKFQNLEIYEPSNLKLEDLDLSLDIKNKMKTLCL